MYIASRICVPDNKPKAEEDFKLQMEGKLFIEIEQINQIHHLHIHAAIYTNPNQAGNKHNTYISRDNTKRMAKHTR